MRTMVDPIDGPLFPQWRGLDVCITVLARCGHWKGLYLSILQPEVEGIRRVDD